MRSIGIVGQGFVGNAIKEGFKDHFNVLTYDKYIESKSNATLEEIVSECDVIFSCVPTPMDMETGEASIDIVREVVNDIDSIATRLLKSPTIIIKSTVPVGTTLMLDRYLDATHVVFSPEFLTEANAVEDFKNQNRVVIGINNGSYDTEIPEYAIKVKEAFEVVFGDRAEIVVTGSPIAEMVKYVTNTFLATKVSYANEIYQLCESSGVEYKDVIKIAKLDKRLGDSHWMVPGPDGDFGFGGHCFPKDLQALRYMASQQTLETKVLDAVLFKNDEVRTDRDWEKQEGRAVINKTHNPKDWQGRSRRQVETNYKVMDIIIKIAIFGVAAYWTIKLIS